VNLRHLYGRIWNQIEESYMKCESDWMRCTRERWQVLSTHEERYI